MSCSSQSKKQNKKAVTLNMSLSSLIYRFTMILLLKLLLFSLLASLLQYCNKIIELQKTVEYL